MRPTLLGGACLFAVTATSAAAQLPQASAATLDKGFDATASGGGFAAVASNPAGLAHRGAPGFSLAMPATSAQAGFGPVTMADIVDFEGLAIGDAVRDEWMARVIASDGQVGRGGVAVTPLAMTIGSLGLQVSSRGSGGLELSPDAVELLLYGNAGRTGTTRDFDLEGSHAEGFAVTTAALSMGFRATDRWLVGVTGKYSIGNGLAVARDGGSFVSASPVAVDLDFPILLPNTDEFQFNNGTGVGMDLGAIWEGSVTLGIMLENVFNTFAWTLDAFEYVPGQAVFDTDDRDSDFDKQALGSAPQALRDDFDALAEEFKLERRLSVGASMAAYPSLVLLANVQKSLTDGMSFDPDFYGSLGLEWSALSFLPLRAHGAVITDGYELSGGTSLVLGPVHLSGGVGLRSESKHDSVLATLALSFGSH